eukprot:TRINITY_DN12177_c0_g1_i1.p1 TRINITY_DN12177_c0_g1~~TRINITY_DN12177_c0_g1_i1.p1  ORF type:complete len:692 (+),score=81.15 TRINITY_DN12177_c0_g1_i1:128-2203(+)
MLPSPKATPATADAPMSPTSEIKFKQKLLIYRLENASTNSHDCSEHAAPQDVAASARKGLLDQSNLPSFPDGDDFYYVCQSPANQHKEIRSTVLSQSHKGFHDGDVNYTCSLSDLVSRTDSSSVDNRENFAAAIQQIRDLVARGNVTTTALQHTSLISNLLDFVQVYSPTHLKRKHEEQLHDTLLQQCLYLMMHLLRGPSLLHTMDMLQLQQLLQLAGESADSRVALHATGVVHSCLARQTKLLKAMAATRLSLGLLSRLQSTASAKLAGALAAVLVKVAAERQGLHVLLKHDAMRICGCALQRWLDDHQAATRPNVLGPLLSLTATLLWNNEQALEQFMQNNGASILVSSFRRSACDPGLAKQTADVIHHVLSVPSSGSLCLHAGLLQVMIDALTSDEMASSVIASFAHLLPQVFTLPALHQSLEHTDQFTTVCTLLLRQQRLEPDTWPTFSSLLTTMATFEPCLRVMHDLAFASLLSDHLACLELAPTSDELGLLLRLAIPPSTSECDGEAAASKPSKHTQDCLGAVVSTVLRTCSSSTVAHPLQRQAASYMCQICSEERHHQALVGRCAHVFEACRCCIWLCVLTHLTGRNVDGPSSARKAVFLGFWPCCSSPITLKMSCCCSWQPLIACSSRRRQQYHFKRLMAWPSSCKQPRGKATPWMCFRLLSMPTGVFAGHHRTSHRRAQSKP